MAERMVTHATIRVASFAGAPLPEDFEEGRVYDVFIDGSVDRDELVDEIEGALRPNPFTLDETWKHTSWGADGSVLEILVQVSSLTGGIASAIYVIEKIAERIRRPTTPSDVTAEMATDWSRRYVARFLDIGEYEPVVIGLERVGDGFRVSLVAKDASYKVEVDKGGVSRIYKTEGVSTRSRLRRFLRR